MKRDPDRPRSAPAPGTDLDLAAWLSERIEAVAGGWEWSIAATQPATAHARVRPVLRALAGMLEAAPATPEVEKPFALRAWLEASAEAADLSHAAAGVESAVLVHDLGGLRSCLVAAAAANGIGDRALPYLDAAIDAILSLLVRQREEARVRQLAAAERLSSMTREGRALDAFLLELLRVFVAGAPEIDSAAIWLVREGELVLRAAVGAPDDVAPGAGTITSRGLPAALLGSSTSVELADFAASRPGGFPSVPPGTHGFYGRSLWHDGLALGLAHFGSRSAVALDPAAKALFAGVVAGATAAAAEEELRARVAASQAGRSIEHLRLRAVLERLPAGVVIADAGGAIVEANPAADRIWGTSIRRLGRLGATPKFRAYLPVTCEPSEWGLAVALASGATVEGRELEIVGFDGHARTVLESSAPVLDSDGALRGAVAVDLDITDLRRTQRERKLVATVGQGLAESLDTRTTVTQIARLLIPEFADWAAVATLDEERGPVMGALETSDPGKRELARHLLATYRIDVAAPHGLGRVIRTGEPELVSDLSPAFFASLGPIPLREVLERLEATSFLCVPMVARGRIVGAVYMAMARSGRRYAPVHLELANELASLAGLALDNARLLDEAREAVRAREEFLSLASHELRTPLTIVLTQVQLAERLLEHGPEPRVRLALERAERQGQRLRKMVNDVLNLAQLVSGNLGLVPEALDLTALSREAIAGLGAATGLPVPAVALDAPARAAGHWDRLRLRQAILALLDNALVYGKGEPIEVVVEDRGAIVRWSVADRGPGLAPEERSQLFQPFRRGARSAQVRGLGLGLFIARRIVEAHGGRIGYDGGPGRKTVFWIELPRDSRAAPGIPEETAPPLVVG